MKRNFEIERFEDCSFEELVEYCKAMKKENASLRGQISELIDSNVSKGIECIEALEEAEICKRELLAIRLAHLKMLETFGAARS